MSLAVSLIFDYMNFHHLIKKVTGEGLAATVARGASGMFAVKVAGAALAFMLQVFLARLMTLESFGSYVYLLAWVNFLTLFAKLGMDSAALRFVPSYVVAEDRAGLLGYLRFGVLLTLLLGGGIGLIGITIANQIPMVTNFGVGTLVLASLLLPVTALYQFLGGALQGLKRVVASQLPQQIGRPIGIIVLMSGALAGHWFDPNVFTVMAANLCVAALVGLFLARSLQRAIPGFVSEVAGGRYEPLKWLALAIPLSIIAGFNILISQADIMMLGVMKGPEESGLYAVASRTAGLISFVLVAVNSVVAPLISQYHANGQLAMLQRILSLAAFGIFSVSVVLVVMVIVFGHLILMLFGAPFVASLDALRILALANLVNASMGPVGYLMTMTGHHRQALLILAFVTVGNLLLNAVLIPPYGALGASMATGVMMVLWNVVMYLYTRRYIELDPSFISILRLRT